MISRLAKEQDDLIDRLEKLDTPEAKETLRIMRELPACVAIDGFASLLESTQVCQRLDRTFQSRVDELAQLTKEHEEARIVMADSTRIILRAMTKLSKLPHVSTVWADAVSLAIMQDELARATWAQRLRYWFKRKLRRTQRAIA